MSNWTHVAAVARIDGWPWDEKDFETIFGKELRYEDDMGVWDDADEHPEKYLPRGREGSLSMSVWTNPDGSCLARYTVSIFGDLRDHDDAQEIIDWFKEKIGGILLVRSACITAYNEWQGKTLVWAWEVQDGGL